MALSHSPKITTNGLVLCLDAANIKSYLGSGTTWKNIAGIGSGVLINGPTFNNLNGGRIVFDGSDDRVDLTSLGISIANSFTYEFWCIPTATHQIDGQSTSGAAGTSGQRYLIDATFFPSPDSGSGISLGTNGVSVYEHAPSYMPPLLVNTTAISSSVPTNIVVTYNNKTPSLYINSNFIVTGSTSPRTIVYGSPTIIGGNPSYGHFQGSVFLFNFYNRTLTATEIQQNFNALRRRFGI